MDERLLSITVEEQELADNTETVALRYLSLVTSKFSFLRKIPMRSLSELVENVNTETADWMLLVPYLVQKFTGHTATVVLIEEWIHRRIILILIQIVL